jgi:hypothetical protein
MSDVIQGLFKPPLCFVQELFVCLDFCVLSLRPFIHEKGLQLGKHLTLACVIHCLGYGLKILRDVAGYGDIEGLGVFPFSLHLTKPFKLVM